MAKRFDVCIIVDRESPRLDSYIYDNLSDLKVIQCFNFSLKKYFKTNFRMSFHEEMKFMEETSFNVGFYENIIKNSEFILFYVNNVFNISYTLLHLGMAIGMNKPIFIIDKNDSIRGRFTVPIHNKFSKTQIKDEVERKWLISKELYDKIIDYDNGLNSSTKLDLLYTTNISQFIDDNGVRYRKQSIDPKSYQYVTAIYPKGYQYIKCIKSDKSEFTRCEIESIIDKELYENKLMEFKESDKYCLLINKERTVFRINDYAQLELNRIKIGSNYLHILEIEYLNETIAKNIDLAYILNDIKVINNDYHEFTNSNELNNKTIMKLNPRKRTEISEFSEYVNTLCKNCFIKIEK